MTAPFGFSRLPLIVFGNGNLSKLPSLIGRYGKSVCLVTGRNSFINSERAGRFLETLKGLNISYRIIRIAGEPSPAVVDNAVRECAGDIPDVVVAIGGGSALDAGKAISAMLNMKESVKTFLEGVGTGEHPGTKVPFIAVPTTSGTGSEATKNAVISETGANGFKKSLRHDNFVPDIALVDPLLTIDVPPDVTAAAGMDAFTQLTEAFLSVKALAYTDALAFEGLRAVSRSLAGCFHNGRDEEKRSDMSFAALTSGICLANAGLGVVHGFAGTIGGMFEIPHGVVCGTLMAKTNEVIIRELRKKDAGNQALAKYALLGELFLGEKGRSRDWYADGFADHLNSLSHELGMKALGDYGIREKDLPAICRQTDIKNNPVPLSEDDLYEILYSRL